MSIKNLSQSQHCIISFQYVGGNINQALETSTSLLGCHESIEVKLLNRYSLSPGRSLMNVASKVHHAYDHSIITQSGLKALEGLKVG
jgi:hypothetical protein